MERLFFYLSLNKRLSLFSSGIIRLLLSNFHLKCFIRKGIADLCSVTNVTVMYITVLSSQASRKCGTPRTPRCFSKIRFFKQNAIFAFFFSWTFTVLTSLLRILKKPDNISPFETHKVVCMYKHDLIEKVRTNLEGIHRTQLSCKYVDTSPTDESWRSAQWFAGINGIEQLYSGRCSLWSTAMQIYWR